MTRDDLYNAINKGAPIYKAMRIEGETDLSLCENERFAFHKAHEKSNKNYKAMLKKYINYEPKYFDNTLRYSIEADKDTSTSYLRGSKAVFIQNVVSLLSPSNMPKISKFNTDQLKEYMQARITLLENIKYASGLEKEFPRLSKYYNDGKPLGERLFREKDSMSKDSIEYKLINIRISDFYRKGYDCTIPRFIKTQALIFSRLIDNFNNILDEIDNITLTEEELASLSKEKMELLIARKYLELAKKINDQTTAEQCLYYINNYLTNSAETNAHLIIKHKIFCTGNLQDEYLKFVMKRPELRLYNAEREEFIGKTQDECLEIISTTLESFDKTKATEVAKKIRFKK